MRPQKIAAAATALVVLVAAATLVYGNISPTPASLARLPEMIKLPAGSFLYRASGSFTRDGVPADAPKIAVTIPRPLGMMVHQVTAAEYRECVAAKACATTARAANSSDRPAVEINWHDANKYAVWLSRETGVHFRLPTDAEWAYAAADRFADDAIPQGVDRQNIGKRELAVYEREAGSADGLEQQPQSLGTFGANRNGLVDLAGNVWEWTDTCFTRNALDERGGSHVLTSSCGVRVVEGRHRAYLADFIRDARGGGCAAGSPPKNLGFRLVREADESRGPWQGLRQSISSARHLFGFAALGSPRPPVDL